MLQKIITIIMIFGFIQSSAQPNVLFLLPGESSIISSRVYNTFSEFYRGKAYWEDISNVTDDRINQFNYIVKLEEETNTNGYFSITVYTYFGNSRGRNSKSSYNSNYRLVDIINPAVIDIVFSLIKELDPNYYEEFKEVFKELSECEED